MTERRTLAAVMKLASSSNESTADKTLTQRIDYAQDRPTARWSICGPCFDRLNNVCRARCRCRRALLLLLNSKLNSEQYSR